MLGRTGAATIVVFAMIGLTASAAAAHATLRANTPAQSSVYPASAPPRAVSLVFDESVNTSPTSISVYNGRGDRIPVIAPRVSVHSSQIGVTLPRLTDGSYVVVWHIVSDDGHPEQGAFTFGVGKGGTTTANIGSLVASQSSGRAVGFAFGVVRALELFACLLFVGGLVFARWFWPGALAREGLRQWLLLWAVVAIAAAALSVPMEAAYTTSGGFATIFDGSAWRDVARARFGMAAIARAVMLLGLASSIRPVKARLRSVARYATEGTVAFLALGVWATFAYAGHGNTGRLVALGFVTDIGHLGAAALWLGGVAALAIGLRDRRQPETNARGAERFSTLALPAVAVIVLSGVIQGWRQIGTWSALWHTSYARLLVIKVLVVVTIVIVASAARSLLRDRVVPAVRVAFHPGSPAAAFDDDAMAELRNSMWVEVLLAVVVLGITASLVVTAPGREAESAARRPAARTLSVDAVGRQVGYAVVVQPGLPGENTIVLTPRLIGQSGFLPSSVSAHVRGTANTAAINLAFTPLADGRWVGTARLSASGNWQLDLIGVTAPTNDTASVQLHIA